jgi:hypothetical protein
LRLELASLGVGRDGLIPLDLAVIQVGDLVHRGPESDAVIELVDRYLHAQPHRWTQLEGNHESIYVRPPAFRWSHKMSRRSGRTIRRWWRDGAAVLATTIDAAGESFLVTHAGVTAGFWSHVIGGPPTAAEAARRINELATTDPDAVFRGGRVLTGTPNTFAGPLWADAVAELAPGWADRRLPFSQIHGHSTIVDWRGNLMNPYSETSSLVTLDSPPNIRWCISMAAD